jgi:glycosyltransferase involved in cell wall biosynthesis
MRILQVIHDFLPRHLAGVEIYTDRLSRRLAAAHEVAILYSEAVPGAENYSLRRGRHGPVATFELVNNHIFRRFEETYANPSIDRRLREVLDEFRPHVVHVQHLLNLSLNLVAEARRRGIPVLMTLHDHWLACANGGQRFHRRLGRCETLDPSRCGPCVETIRGFDPEDRGGLLDRLSELGEAGCTYLTERHPDQQQASSPSYIYRDRYALDGDMLPTWVEHPPARMTFRIKNRGSSIFRAAVSMHPNTFAQPGGGVRFTVLVDGEQRFSKVLDPKRRREDRIPHSLRVPIAEPAFELELVTEAVPADDASHCTAGWIHPRLELAANGDRAVAPRLVTWPKRFSQRRRVERRWQAVRKMIGQVDYFLAPSRYLVDEFVRFGLDPRRIAYSDNGFVTDGFECRADLPETARVFAFVGSLVQHKGLHVLVEAFESLPEDAELRVCGALDYDLFYTNQIRNRRRHAGIRFLGSLPNEQIPGLLAEVDCLVVPSIWAENSPLTIHEAFLAGVPVIASRLGGHQDLLADGGGLLYDPDDPGDLARSLLRVIEEPGLLRRLAASIPAVKTMDDHVEELVGHYRRLISERPRRSAKR